VERVQGTGASTASRANRHCSLALFPSVLVLTFPVRIIWQIKVRWTKKLALGFSLCLTAVLLALSVPRVIAIQHASKRHLFETSRNLFWLAIATFVGLILTSATALRSLFVAHTATADAGPRRLPHHHGAAAGNGGADDGRAANEGAVAVRAPLVDEGQRRKNGGEVGGWGTRLLLSLRSISGEQNPGGSASADPSASATSGTRTAARPNDVSSGGGRSAPEPQGSLARLVVGSRLWWRLPDDSMARGTMTGMRTFIWGGSAAPDRRTAAAISGNDSAAATVKTEVTWETHTSALAASV
jgi:hypothetical protein